MLRYPPGIRRALIKDSQAHKNLVVDGVHPTYMESYDMQTQIHLSNIEMEHCNK